MGVAFITTAIFLVPRIGVVNVLFIGLAGQIIVSVLIDHHGLFGLMRHPVNLWKIAGLGLIAIGIVLLKREAPASVPRPTTPPAAAEADSRDVRTPPAARRFAPRATTAAATVPDRVS